VAYFLEFTQQAKIDLHDLPALTREGRNKLFASLAFLREISDAFRADPINRHAGLLSYTLVMEDEGRVRSFVFAVDDSHVQAGVLRVVSVADITPL